MNHRKVMTVYVYSPIATVCRFQLKPLAFKSHKWHEYGKKKTATQKTKVANKNCFLADFVYVSLVYMT